MRCSYKNSLRGCEGNGIVENHVVVHYNLREYEDLHLCAGCTEKIILDVLNELDKGLSIYVFDLEYNLLMTASKGD